MMCKSKEEFKELNIDNCRIELENLAIDTFGPLTRQDLNIIDLFEEKLHETRIIALKNNR